MSNKQSSLSEKIQYAQKGERVEFLERLIKAHILTPNEARELLSLPPVPNGGDIR